MSASSVRLSFASADEDRRSSDASARWSATKFASRASIRARAASSGDCSSGNSSSSISSCVAIETSTYATGGAPGPTGVTRNASSAMKCTSKVHVAAFKERLAPRLTGRSVLFPAATFLG